MVGGERRLLPGVSACVRCPRTNDARRSSRPTIPLLREHGVGGDHAPDRRCRRRRRRHHFRCFSGQSFADPGGDHRRVRQRLAAGRAADDRAGDGSAGSAGVRGGAATQTGRASTDPCSASSGWPRSTRSDGRRRNWSRPARRCSTRSSRSSTGPASAAPLARVGRPDGADDGDDLGPGLLRRTGHHRTPRTRVAPARRPVERPRSHPCPPNRRIRSSDGPDLGVVAC